jgi:hypothetical protein
MNMDRAQLLSYLRDRVGRWRFVWWNGEMVPIGEAILRAQELPEGCEILVQGDDIVVPKQLDPRTTPRC